MDKRDRINKKKNKIGSRHRRKLKRYSNKFKKIFNFFLNSNRSGLIEFCGSNLSIEFDVNGLDARECFRLYEDGYYKNKKIVTRHKNLLTSILISKKGWGLWLDQWTDGICDFSFTKEEILEQFNNLGIVVPKPLLKDFDNTLRRKKEKRNLEYLSQLRNKN